MNDEERGYLLNWLKKKHEIMVNLMLNSEMEVSIQATAIARWLHMCILELEPDWER